MPAGWDTETKIDLIRVRSSHAVHSIHIQEGVTDVDVPLEPTREKTTLMREQFVEAEDEQKFLEKLLERAAVAGPATAASGTGMPGAAATTALKKPLADEDDTKSPLANFFSNLLKVISSFFR